MRASFGLVLLLLMAHSASAAWPSFHNDERNTGFQAGSDYAVYEDVWWNLKIAPATQVEASAVVEDGIVIIADWAKTVRALDAESGAEKWKATFTAKISGTPAIASSKVFVVDESGSLKSFDLQKGTELGTTNVGATKASLTIHEGKIFVGNEAGEMKALDTETLTVLWRFTPAGLSETVQTTTTPPPNPVTTTTCKDPIPTGPIRGAAAVYAGKVFFGSLSHYFFAVNEFGTGGQATNLQWFFKAGDAIFGSPLIDTVRGTLTIGALDEKVYTFPASPSGQGPILVNGQVCSALRNTPVWTYSVPSTIGQSKVYSSPASDGTRIYVGANNGNLYAINAGTGAKVWEFVTGGAVYSSPAVSNGIVVAGSDDGNVYWLNATDGLKLKQFSMGSAVKASPALDGKRAFLSSFEGSVYMFGPKIPPRPDLSVSAVSYLDGAIRVAVLNSGNGPSNATNIRLQVDGVLVADAPLPAIAAGATTTVVQPHPLTEGAHVIQAIADFASTEKESKESNNELTTAVTAEAKASFLLSPLVFLVALVLLAARRR
ncbi:MAG: PQQ-binding-like beta-propeller repeat protein [Candidatus Thermoplasmatota archaeon]